METGISVFDPALCELLYTWFCPAKGKILDPFAGGSVRGIIAHKMEYDYTGIELRKEQVESNIEQGKIICPEREPKWICGDSNKILDTISEEYDFIFSCPPYVDLEIYSDDKDDLSTMNYEDFLLVYKSIIAQSKISRRIQIRLALTFLPLPSFTQICLTIPAFIILSNLQGEAIDCALRIIFSNSYMNPRKCIIVAAPATSTSKLARPYPDVILSLTELYAA